DAERGVEYALGEKRQHDQPRHDVGAVADAVDLGHARADGGTEHHEVKRGGDHRRDQRLQQSAQGARHLEPVDGQHSAGVEAGDDVAGHDSSLTRLTKISSSELCRVSRSRKAMARSLMRRSSDGTPVRSSLMSKVYSSSKPPALMTRFQSASSGGTDAIGSCR